MPKPSTTWMELLARKAQLKIAQHGYELLDEKRTALMHEIMRIADTVLKDTEILQKYAAIANISLARAEAAAGPEAVRSASMITHKEFPLKIDSTNIMGVTVPIIEHRSVSRSIMERGYAITGTSITIDEAATSFEAEVQAIILLADSELRLKRLLQEIQRTTRRLNALEHLLIPKLKDERDHIQMALDERERSDHFRLKLSKRLLEKRREKIKIK